jgi:mRNA-degrading endonuclease toxin of MazEF toxin-antitoxin module
MAKDFNNWNIEKQNLERNKRSELIFHAREIWWCSIGVNLGDEQDGKNRLYERPVLVLRKFNNKVAWILPMTTKNKIGDYYYQLEHDGNVSSVILSQLKLVSVKRFRRLIRQISQYQFALIQDKVINLIRSPEKTKPPLLEGESQLA